MINYQSERRMNDTFLRALLRQPVDYTPVWIMRQAGRYLPEYRATRKHAGSFMDLCRNADFATEVTLQPLERYALDAAILFSDILTVPDAMGLGLYFVEGEGPRFTSPLQTEAAIKKLRAPEVDISLQYVFSAVKQIRQALNERVPLIGFAGSPFTLACYMVEGGSSRDFMRLKTMLYDRPDLLHHILAVNTETTIAYLNGQIAAGAQAIMIFDTWGGALSHTAYQTFSLAYMQQIVNQLTPTVNGQVIPVVIFTKGGGLWLKSMAESGCHALGLDWTVNLQQARAQVGEKVALQGNMDPSILFASPQVIEAEVAGILAEYGHGSGHVFNLGHGISQFTSPEHVTVFINAVHELSRPYHQ
jgi:uroporphyrinogen decarboxylase